jgi:hypothetical protein
MPAMFRHSKKKAAQQPSLSSALGPLAAESLGQVSSRETVGADAAMRVNSLRLQHVVAGETVGRLLA